jgi:uncharacterized membrane protein HdeD (DUF308 family)
MTAMLMRSWWALALRGVAALLLALTLLPWPHGVTMPLQTFIGVYVLLDGLCCLMCAVPGRRHLCSLALLCGSSAGLLAGIASLVRFGGATLTVEMYQYVLAGWAVIVGLVALACGSVLWHTTPGPLRIIELATHWRFRRAGAGAQREWALILAGLAALAFSGLMLLPADSRPIAAAPLIGLFAVVFGYLHLRAGLSLGGLAHGMLRADEQPASLSTELAGPKERTP